MEEKGFFSEGKIKSDLLSKRDEIMSEIVLLHIPFILKAIEEFKDADFRSKFRMAEWSTDFGS